MTLKKKIFLFTGSFPYPEYRENTFLENEIKFLSQYFNLTIIPSNTNGIAEPIDVNIIVDKDFSKHIEFENKKSIAFKTFRLLTQKWLHYELFCQLKNIIKNPRKVKAIIYDGYLAHVTQNWFQNKYSNSNNQILIYTYWLNAITFGLSLCKKNNKLISRAHNVDLYEERSLFIPFRKQTLKKIDKVMLISQNGLDYLRLKYSKFTKKYNLFRLGTLNEHKPKLSIDNNLNIYRIVSCSSISEVKRVLLIPQILNLILKDNEEIKIEWVHIGDGPLALELKKYINRYKNDRFSIKITGYLRNSEIFKFYNENYINLFLNISSYEGVPFTIMEAQSFGIPVIATDVGGNNEIVNDNVGLLLDYKLELKELANSIQNFIEKNKDQIELRVNSYKNWMQNYNSNKNSKAFVNFLLELNDK